MSTPSDSSDNVGPEGLPESSSGRKPGDGQRVILRPGGAANIPNPACNCRPSGAYPWGGTISGGLRPRLLSGKPSGLQNGTT